MEISVPHQSAPAGVLADFVPGLVWRAGPDGRCTYLNRAWLAFTGSSPASNGSGWLEAIHPDDRPECLARSSAAIEARIPYTVFYRLRRHDGLWRWIVDHAAPLTAEDGIFDGHVGCGTDIHEHRVAQNELRLALDEKSTLLAELQHRVRNTVQMTASVLTLQARRAAAPEAARLLSRSARRVRAMGLAQERLFARTAATGRVDLAPYLVELARELVLAHLPDVRLDTAAESIIVLPGLAAPLGFMVSELVANALQHAFPQGRPGGIRLELRRSGGLGEVVVGDDGIGLPPAIWSPGMEYPIADMISGRIGLTLLAGLARQAQAHIGLERAGGALFRIRFPLR